MSRNYLDGALRWALAVGFICGAGTIVRAEDESKGVVQIGRADAPERPDADRAPDGAVAGEARVAPQKYWIGLLAGPIQADHPLRAQIDVPENQGLLVAEVVPKSPAAKAGLKQHDILLKGNDNDLREMKDLITLVMTEGSKKGEIKLDVLRRNKHETLTLKPEDRPADIEVPLGDIGPGGAFAYGQSNQFDPMAGRGMPRPNGPGQFTFRNFGPGVIVGDSPFAGLNNFSINIQKEDNKPTHIVVQRGEDKWDITGDDPEALKKLPDDLRPAVERMLHGGGSGGGMGGAMGGPGTMHMPNFPPQGFGPDSNRMLEQLQRMEKRLNDMQRQMNGRPAPPAEDSNDAPAESK